MALINLAAPRFSNYIYLIDGVLHTPGIYQMMGWNEIVVGSVRAIVTKGKANVYHVCTKEGFTDSVYKPPHWIHAGDDQTKEIKTHLLLMGLPT